MQAYTEPNGHFGFEPVDSSPTPSFAPASDDPSQLVVDTEGSQDLLPGLAHRLNCRLSADLPGYSSTELHVGFLGSDGTTLLSDSEGGVAGDIVLRMDRRYAGHAASETMAAAPAIAVAAYEDGMRMLRQPRPDGRQAAHHLERTLNAYPVFAEAWVALGEARWILGMLAEATQAFARSINADPKFLPPYEMLIHRLLEDQDWSELEWLTEHYLAMSSNSPVILHVSAAAAVNLGEFAHAEKRVLELQLSGHYDNWPKSNVILGMVHESRYECREAAKY